MGRPMTKKSDTPDFDRAWGDTTNAIFIDDDQTEEAVYEKTLTSADAYKKALTDLQARILEEVESRLFGVNRLAGTEDASGNLRGLVRVGSINGSIDMGKVEGIAAAIAQSAKTRAKSYDEMNYIYVRSAQAWTSITWDDSYQVKPGRAKEPEAPPLVPERGKRKIVLE